MSATAVPLPVAFRDARAADLHLTLGHPPDDALVARTLTGLGWELDLRILGASHQVVLRHDAGATWSERVACRSTGDAATRPLPSRHAHATDGLAYRFRSGTLHLDPDALGAAVDVLVEELAADPLAVCGVFPGSALAVTGIRARVRSAGAVSWRTWHTYPRTGEVVVTCTSLVRRPSASGEVAA